MDTSKTRQLLLQKALSEFGFECDPRNPLHHAFIMRGEFGTEAIVDCMTWQQAFGLDVGQTVRLAELRRYLQTKNLEVRFDSDLCLKFILFARGQPYDIALRLREAKYLHESCNFQQGYEDATPQMTPAMPIQEKRALIRKCVLANTQDATYPFARKPERALVKKRPSPAR